jgi:predicted CoA-binding protein
VAGTDEVVERILTTYDTITVVGASADPAKAAHGVPAGARQTATAAGLLYVENRCIAVERRRLGLDAPSPCGTASGGGTAR